MISAVISNRVEKPALIAALIAPVQSVAGWSIAGALWPGYDPVRLTISDLAAPESPVSVIMSSFFLFGALLSIVVAVWAKSFTKLGRLTFLISGICTIGLTIFPTPLDSYSVPHRIFAISGFLISAIWPVLAMTRSKSAPVFLRPTWSIIAMLLQGILALWFLFVWADPNTTDVGIWERVVAVQQTLYASAIVISLYLFERRLPS